MKDFDKWNKVKKQINNLDDRKYVKIREIWWCSLGINIGQEQDGRDDNFERPILIIQTLSPKTFLAAPLSTKKKLEKFQSEVTHDSVKGFALLDQIRVLDTNRLKRKIGRISKDEFKQIRDKLINLL